MYFIVDPDLLEGMIQQNDIKGTTKGAILSSFVKLRKKRIDSRIILKEFINMIAT